MKYYKYIVVDIEIRSFGVADITSLYKLITPKVDSNYLSNKNNIIISKQLSFNFKSNNVGNREIEIFNYSIGSIKKYDLNCMRFYENITDVYKDHPELI